MNMTERIQVYITNLFRLFHMKSRIDKYVEKYVIRINIFHIFHINEFHISSYLNLL